MAMKTPVSILSCTYNQGRYIEETIKSVLAQTYQDWEWVILDDGSTDATQDIVANVRDDRIRYFYQTQQGVDQISCTFNKALNKCTGDLIATLDCDDYWPRHKLDVQIKRFSDPDTVLSYGEAWLVNERGKKLSYIPLPDDERIASNDPLGYALNDLLINRSCFIVNSTVMYKRRALLRIGGFVKADGMFQDYPTWVRLSLEGKFSTVPVLLGYYRKHSRSSSMLKNPERLFDCDIAFFRNFILQHRDRITDLGFSYDINRVEENWEEKRRYLNYNTALYLLMIGGFEESQEEFRRFLEKMPSAKNRLIFDLVRISAFIGYDVVNPIALLKQKCKHIFFGK